MSDEACGAMLILVSRHSTEVPGGHEVVYVCMRDPHDRGRHRQPIGDSAVEWETRGEDQPVTRAASR